ncbi:MAG: outer membrane lipoprotein-sorting protein [Candidatus Omnitrophica bacterium]|nr:outer membrane lipoprotein-sorting protein [Candidatus Omnitrophota bacterium]
MEKNLNKLTSLLFFWMTVLAFLLPVTGLAQEETPTAREIAKRTEERNLGDTMISAIEMLLINAQGQVRRREFVVYRKEFPDGERTLYKFLYPDDIKNTATLNIEVPQKDDIQYLYVPAAKKIRRISTKNQSWLGSEIYYEDLEEVDLDHWKFELLGSETIDGFDCWIFSQTPVDPDDSMYGKIIRSVRKSDYVPMKRIHYDKNGDLFKYVWMKNWIETDGVFYSWHNISMNMKDYHRTVINRRWIILNHEIPDDFFTTRFAEKSIDFYDRPKNMKKMWSEAIAQLDPRNIYHDLSHEIIVAKDPQSIIDFYNVSENSTYQVPAEIDDL